jgi:hypothetical protein
MADHDRDPRRHLSAAVEAIASERRKCKAEKAALRRFRSRIRDLSDDATPDMGVHATSHGTGRHTGTAMTSAGTGASGNSTRQRRIRTAYRETVMSTDAATELEEAPAEHMAAELGPDISMAVFVSSDPPPNLLTMIDRSATNLIDARDKVVRKLDDERSLVDTMGEEVASITEEVDSYESAFPVLSFEELTTSHRRLGELKDDCTSIAERRQSEFHSKFVGRYTRFEWAEYLYADCPVTHPILAAITELIQRIDELRRTLRRKIATV